MEEKFLNLGSVIKLENGATAMIIGYFPTTDDGIYLYSAVPYPTGLMTDDALALIDEDTKYELLFDGYSDDETEKLKDEIADVIVRLAEEVKKAPEFN